jgi:hypothetical protein
MLVERIQKPGLLIHFYFCYTDRFITACCRHGASGGNGILSPIEVENLS